jgi:hypothetical protein
MHATYLKLCKTDGITWIRVFYSLSGTVNHWGYFIYLNWMPTYFYKVLGEQKPPARLVASVRLWH